MQVEADIQRESVYSGHRPKKCLTLNLEQGNTWDECLLKFTESSININFYNNIISYSAGDPISGTIDIDLKKSIEA
jgi:hypothetical protein